MKKALFIILYCILGAVFIYSAVHIAITLYGYHEADVLYEELQEQYVTPNTPQSSGNTSRPNSSSHGSGYSDPGMLEDEEPAPVRVNFEALLETNNHVVGWLYCEGTPINYPVVQYKNNDYYLHRDINRKYLSSGTLFVDFRCGPLGTEQNHIIYGHNMRNSTTMFGSLMNYKKQAYYDEHPVIYYLTPNGDYRIDLFAGYVTGADADVYFPSFGTADDFDAVLRYAIKRSTFKTDVTVTGEDHVVMLSTCSTESNSARYVAFGKLVPLDIEEE